jgi:hypothetical protein
MAEMTRVRVEPGLGWVGDHADMLARVAKAIGHPVVEDFNGDDLIAYPGVSPSVVWKDWIDRRRARQGPDKPLLPRRQPEERGGWGAPERELDREQAAHPAVILQEARQAQAAAAWEVYKSRELDRDGTLRSIREWGAVAQEQRSCTYERWSIWSCALDPDTMPLAPWRAEPEAGICYVHTEFVDRLNPNTRWHAYCQRAPHHTGRHLDFNFRTGHIAAVWP